MKFSNSFITLLNFEFYLIFSKENKIYVIY